MLIDTRPLAIMRGMKLQFSLATLLICMTVLAVVCAVSLTLPVYETTRVGLVPPWFSPDGISQPKLTESIYDEHQPTGSDVIRRLAIWWPPALATALGVLWIVRRLKSHQHSTAGRVKYAHGIQTFASAVDRFHCAIAIYEQAAGRDAIAPRRVPRRSELSLLRQTIRRRASRLSVLPADQIAFGIKLPACSL